MGEVTFTSRINFVSQSAYKKVVKEGDKYIPFHIYGFGEYSAVADSFHTEEVRTCSAGGLKGKKKSLGLHVRDSKVNLDNVKNIYSSLKQDLGEKPERGLLIGSKDLWNSDYSLPVFKKLTSLFTKDTNKVSIFQTHTNKGAESSIHYSAKTDTWTINTQIYNNETCSNEDVLTPKGLKNAFKKIIIADGDTLCINGKEVKL